MANAKKTAKQSEPITAPDIIANEPPVIDETLASETFSEEEKDMILNFAVKAAKRQEAEDAIAEFNPNREAPASGETPVADNEAAADAKTWLKARKYGPLEAGGDEATFLEKLLHLIQIGAWNHFQPLLEARLKAVKNDSAE